MQEKQSQDQLRTAARRTTRGRHRAPSRPINRHPYLASLLVAVAGFGLAGISASSSEHDRAAESVAAATDERARAEAASRADRSSRDETAPATPRTVPSSPAEVSTSPSSTATKPSPSEKETPEAAKETAKSSEPPAKPAWVHPMPGATVTSCFGPRWGVMHAGIDLAKPANTPVRAAGAGTVTAAGWLYAGYGISVVIDHGNGYLTHYAHLNRADVQPGDWVDAGDVIGREGSTGDSTGPHLHFEVHNGMWNQINPAPWMRARGVDLGC